MCTALICCFTGECSKTSTVLWLGTDSLVFGPLFEEVFPGKYAIFGEAGFVGFGDVVIYNC